MAKKDIRGKGKWSAESSRRGKVRLKSFKCGCREAYKRLKGTWRLRAQTVCLDHVDADETDVKRLGKKL